MTVRDLFEPWDREGLSLERLLASHSSGLLVCTPETIDYARQRGLAPTGLDDLRAAAARSADTLIVCAPSLSAEFDAIARVRLHAPSARTIGLFWNVFLPRIARCSDPEARGRLGTKASRKIAILALPRSGSTLLASLLSDGGLGRCEEHLRPPLMRLLAREPQWISSTVDRLMQLASHDGCFSTKLISHFVFEFERTVACDGAVARFLDDRGFACIYLRRADKVSQAVSAFWAAVTGVYHATAMTGDTYAPPDYAFDDILRFYQSFVRQERRLESLAAGLARCQTLHYADLSRNPASVAAPLVDALGGRSADVAGTPRVQRMPATGRSEMIDRFIRDYRHAFASDPEA